MTDPFTTGPYATDPFMTANPGYPALSHPQNVAAAADLPVAEQSSSPLTAESPAPRPCPHDAGDLFLDLNGFDEIAIANYFGAPVQALKEDAVTLGRALAFIHERRTGRTDKEAYEHVMNLTIGTISHGYFTPTPKPDADASAEGNGDGA